MKDSGDLDDPLDVGAKKSWKPVQMVCHRDTVRLEGGFGGLA